MAGNGRGHMKMLIAAALLLGAAPASATKVEVATGNWSNIPLLKSRTFNVMSAEVVESIHRTLKNRECVLPGQTKDRINLRVPFLVQFRDDGGVERLVVRKLNCAPIERLVASVLLKQVESGDHKATGANNAGWYRSELRFSSD